MKVPGVIFVPLLLLVILPFQRGETADDEDIKVISVSAIPVVRAEPVFHVFGGKPFRVMLDLKGKREAEIVIKMFQTASGLSMPLGPALDCGVFSPGMEGRQNFEIELPIPKVEKRLKLTAELAQRREGMLYRAGRFQILVYPENMAGSLEKFLGQMKNLELAIFGEGTEIRNYLKKHEMKFTDVGQIPPTKLETKTLYVGDASSDALRDWKPVLTTPVALVVFTANDELLPGVYEEMSNTLTIRKVTLPILQSLESDPRSEASFIAAITQISLPPAILENP